MNRVFEGMADALLAAFGETEPVTVTVSGTPHPLEMAFLAPWTGTTLAGVPIDRRDMQGVCRADELLLTGAAVGSTVERDATVYTIADTPKVDEAGLARLTLRKYT